MEMKRENFFEIIQEVSESRDLSSDNVLKKVQDKLKEKSDENGIDSPYTIVYNIFKSNNFYKNHEFKLQMPDGTTARGTLLHFAVQCGNALMVKLLLENKVSVTMKDHSGLTPLDIAISNGNQEIIQLLRKANPQLEKNKDKTPEDLVVKGNNATAALENGNKRTSLNSTDKSSDSTVDEQYPRVNVKNIVKNFELPQKINATYSNEQTSISLNESSSSNDSGIFTESEDGEDIDAKNEESKSHVTEYQSKLEALEKKNQEENQSLKQKIQDLESENATLKGGLGKTKTKTNEVPLEKAQKELEVLRNCVTGHGTRLDTLEKLNEENESLRQEIKNLKNENTTLKGELEKTKTKKNEVPLEKAQKELTELGNCVTEHETKLEVLEKLNEENESLEQKIQDLESKNTTLNSELEENENKHSKTKVLLERTQKELEESKSCIAGHETKLKQFNKENESLRQEIKSLENENTTLKGELGKTKTNEVSLEKVGKRQFSPKVVYASLAAMLVVGAALSIASGLSALLIVAASVVSALIAGGITYTISKPIAPDTELKEVDIGSAQRGVCKT
ncbi:ankyrin repeat domain-containing protein [Wolbachia endosymbiont (group A) of Pogonocherus hispidulus]|uniref:ankyrin repeat domain-containing protein n=1 Tax=Wolbachia endosymbiont (group A) of Pogonocherus hispidulus TaxID=3066136 RepID=UPI0033409343